ncbi:MAG: nitroreductase family protein [Clostridium sp.]
MLELLKQRRSIRKYRDLEVEKEVLEKILNVAMLAPTSMNKKPVEFIIVEDKETLLKLEGCKKIGTLALKTAPLAIVVIADKEKSDVWVEDASIAAILIQMEVEALGLGSCWIQMRNRQSETGDSEKDIRRVLNIPENFGVLSVLTIGYKYEFKEPYQDSNIELTRVHNNKYI